MVIEVNAGTFTTYAGAQQYQIPGHPFMNSKKTSTVQPELLLIVNAVLRNCPFISLLAPIIKSVRVTPNASLKIFDYNVFMILGLRVLLQK